MNQPMILHFIFSLFFFFRSLLPGGKPVCVLSPGEQLPLKFPDRCKTNVINAAMFLSDPPPPPRQPAREF